jgi:hypothetical protein
MIMPVWLQCMEFQLLKDTLLQSAAASTLTPLLHYLYQPQSDGCCPLIHELSVGDGTEDT